MKIVFPAFVIILAFSIFMPAIEAAKSPSPSPAPTQVAPPIPPPQLALSNQLAATLSQPARAWVDDEAAKVVKNAKVTEGNIRADIQTRFTGQSLTDADKNILLFIVLTEAAGKMANDLNDMFAAMVKQHSHDEAPPTPGENGNTTINATPGEMMLLQTAVQRRTELMTIMSNLIKKVSGTQGVVLGNLQ